MQVDASGTERILQRLTWACAVSVDGGDVLDFL
jgi:hypothetical protein